MAMRFSLKAGLLCFSILVIVGGWAGMAHAGPLQQAHKRVIAALNTAVSPSAAAITLEQSAPINTSNVSSTAPTITPNAANNLLVIGVGAFNSTGSATVSVSDDIDGSWTRANTTEIWAIGPQGYTAIFYIVCSSTAERTVTISMSTGDAYFAGVIAEYSGVASSSPLDVQATGTGSSTTPLATTGTTSQADALVLSFSYINGNPSCTTPSSYVSSGEVGTSFVNVAAQQVTTTDYETAAFEQKIVSSTGIQASSWVYSSSSSWGCVTAVFKGQ